MIIDESNMTFGPFPDDHCFYIEKSDTYRKTNSGLKSGLKMAEFLWLRITDGQPPAVWLVEAKSSSPKPGNKIRFNEFINEIRDKLTNAFSLGLASCLKRHQTANAELPEPFRQIDFSASEFRFILVIHGHDRKGLPPLQEALVKALLPMVRIWAISPNSVFVINDVLARKHGLIAADADEAA